MNCPKCNEKAMEWQCGGGSLDFSHEFEEWMECKKCGYVCDVPNF